MTTTKQDLITMPELTAGFPQWGPWSSTYDVNVKTLAVNLACHANGHYFDDEKDPALAVELAVLDFEGDIIKDGSIAGFWAEMFSRLDQRAHSAVVALAVDYLTQHAAAPFGGKGDLYERFDGQR